MKLKKKRCVIFGMLLCLLFLISAEASAAKRKNAIWYESVINSNKGNYYFSEYLSYPRSSFKYYKLLDINGDGIKEMFLSMEKGIAATPVNLTLLLTYYNGKVTALGPFYRGGLYVKGKYLCNGFYVPGYGDSPTVCVLENGKLKSVDTYYSVCQQGGGWKYYDKNKKEVSKKKYDSFRRKYFTKGQISCTSKLK